MRKQNKPLLFLSFKVWITSSALEVFRLSNPHCLPQTVNYSGIQNIVLVPELKIKMAVVFVRGSDCNHSWGETWNYYIISAAIFHDEAPLGFYLEPGLNSPSRSPLTCVYSWSIRRDESHLCFIESTLALFSSVSLQLFSPPAAGRRAASRVRADCLWEATATERSACRWASAAPSWTPKAGWWVET